MKDYEDEWFDDLEKKDEELTTEERRHKYINDNNL